MLAMGTVTLAGIAQDVPFPTVLHSSGSLMLPVALKVFLDRISCLAVQPEAKSSGLASIVMQGPLGASRMQLTYVGDLDRRTTTAGRDSASTR